MDVVLRMGHHPEDEARRIGDAGNVADRAVGIVGVATGAVPEHDTVAFFDGVEVGGHETALTVGDRTTQRVGQFGGPHAGTARIERDPAAFESPGYVLVEGGGAGRALVAGQEPGANQRLETVADADDRFAGVDRFVQLVGEPADEIQAEQASGAEGITVGEATGQGEDLIVAEIRRYRRGDPSVER